jgi:hypothetical protein
MKKFILITLFITTIAFSQNTNKKNTEFYLQEELQNFVDTLVNNEYLNFDKEVLKTKTLLDSKDKAIQFAKNLLLLKYPFLKKEEIQFEISEDRTNKLWFVNATFNKNILSMTGKEVQMIIVKMNCKVLYFYVVS